MANRPAMSNRDLLIVLSTLRGKLGHQAFKANLAKAIAAQTNLLISKQRIFLLSKVPKNM